MRVPVSFRKDRRLEFLLQIPARGGGGDFYRDVFSKFYSSVSEDFSNLEFIEAN